MNTALKYNYDEIRDMVFQMTEEDQERLSHELLRPVFRSDKFDYAMASEAGIPFEPSTKEGKIAAFKRADEEIRKGNVISAEDFLKEMKNEFPWLYK